jgi:hypothetical protein
MKAEFRHTFFSLQTGHDLIKKMLFDATSDEWKAKIILKNRRCWNSIRPQAEEFYHANWDRWVREKPDWFTDNFVGKVDDDLIPEASLKMPKKKQGSGAMLRVSLFDDLIGRGNNSS